jgi:hypothetical protein
MGRLDSEQNPNEKECVVQAPYIHGGVFVGVNSFSLDNSFLDH